MREASVRDLVHDSLVAIRDECPSAHARIGDALGTRKVRVSVGAEVVWVNFAESVVVGAEQDADVDIVVGRAGLVDLVLGRDTVEDALLGGRLDARGSLEDLLAFHEGLRGYVAGAVRSPSAGRLMARFLKFEVEEEGSRGT